MIELKDIENLATLARIEVSEDEKKTLVKDFESILGYMSDIKNIKVDSDELKVGDIHNVMREDADPHEVGVFTDEILENAPDTKDGYVRVKKIL